MTTGLTVNRNLPPEVQAYYDKRFLLRAKPNLAAYQFAQKRELPGGVGGTVYFSRMMPLAKVHAPLTETHDGGLTLATRQKLKSEEISATAEFWGDYVAISKLASVVSLNPALNEKVDIVSQQAGESIDYYVMKTMARGLLRRRADSNAAFQVEGTAASGTATTLVDPALTQAADHWVGGYITIMKGQNYGITRRITASAVGSVTFDAFPKPIDATSQYRIVVGTGLSSADVLATPSIRLAVRDLKRALAMNYERGYFVGLINPDIEYDFMRDSTWVDAAKYKDGIDALYTGEIGRWFGVRFVDATQLFREDPDGTENETGSVHLATILGKEAYGVVELAGQKRKIYTMTSEQLGQPIPMYNTCGWQVGFEAVPLNSMFGVSILCGASA